MVDIHRALRVTVNQFRQLIDVGLQYGLETIRDLPGYEFSEIFHLNRTNDECQLLSRSTTNRTCIVAAECLT